MQPIKMNQKIINDILTDVYTQIASLNVLKNEKVSISKMLSKPAKDAVEVNFTPEAYHEMCMLIDHFDTEVAWHGLVDRIDKTHFRITKILVYPQKVTGATVNTDQEKYTNWQNELDDDTFNALRFQGHSHVNMSTNPSSVDMDKQWEMINNFEDDVFYIFMIWNKKRNYNVRVVDMAENVIYSGDDVKVTIGDTDMKSFLTEAKKFIEKPNYTYAGGYSANTGTYAGGAFVGKASTTTATPAKEAETKPAAVIPASKCLKTVTGGAAPKLANGNGNKSNLANYYQKNPDELVKNWNSSCYPYENELYND